MSTSIITKESLRRKNFSPDEFFASETAKKHQINNETDSLAILTALMLLADKMQEIRDLLGHAIKINSAYRCAAVNKLVGSKPTSQHIQGLACDFICPDFGTPEKIVDFLKENKIVVDQCIQENSWVHVSIKHSNNRNQFAKLIDGKFQIL